MLTIGDLYAKISQRVPKNAFCKQRQRDADFFGNDISRVKALKSHCDFPNWRQRERPFYGLL